MRVSTTNFALAMHLHNQLSHIIYGIGVLVTALRGLHYKPSCGHWNLSSAANFKHDSTLELKDILWAGISDRKC